MIIQLKTQEDTIVFGRKLAKCSTLVVKPIIIYLTGDLGVGKTTLARGFIKYFGFKSVKSPTYSLVESYKNDIVNIHHFDCFRISCPEELEYIGIREYLIEEPIQLIEWAELAKNVIAPADIKIKLSGYSNHKELVITSHSIKGWQLLEHLIKLSY